MVSQPSTLDPAGQKEDAGDAQPGCQQQKRIGNDGREPFDGGSIEGDLDHGGLQEGGATTRPAAAPRRHALGVSEPGPLGVLILTQVPALTSFQALP